KTLKPNFEDLLERWKHLQENPRDEARQAAYQEAFQGLFDDLKNALQLDHQSTDLPPAYERAKGITELLVITFERLKLPLDEDVSLASKGLMLSLCALTQPENFKDFSQFIQELGKKMNPTALEETLEIAAT